MATITTTQSARPKALHITLWFAQAIVAGMFMMAGSMKTFTPIAELSVMIPWAKDSEVLIRFIGISELLGALGLILPAALRIAPRLTVWAAYGLTLILILAFLFHLIKAEVAALPTPFILGLLSGFVAWGRSVKAPIHQRE